jgi:hypothetical protein
VVVLGEPFSLRLVLGGLIVVLGVALVQGRLFGPRPAPSRFPSRQPATDGRPGQGGVVSTTTWMPSLPGPERRSR